MSQSSNGFVPMDIELTTKTFVQLMGALNIPCHCKECPQHSDILKALVEYRCDIEDSDLKPLSWFPQKVHARWNQPPPPFRRLTGLQIWREHASSRQEVGYIDAYAAIKNCRRVEACEQLGKQYGYDTIYDPQFGTNPKHSSARKFCAIRDCCLQLFVDEIPIGGEVYSDADTIHFLTAQKQLYAAQILYRSKSRQEIIIPGHIENYSWWNGHEFRDCPTLIPGVAPGSAYYLFNEDLLEANPDAMVFLCDDLRVADDLTKIIQDSKRLSATDFIVTATFSGTQAIPATDWKGLARRRVVYLPAPTPDSYRAAFEYAKACSQCDVQSFSVLKVPVCRFDTKGSTEEIEALQNPWERHAIKEAIILPKHESAVLYKMADEACTLEEFTLWGQHIGLFTEKKQTETDKKYGAESGADLLQVNVSGFPQAANLSCLASPGEIGLLMAEQNAGKTLLAVSFTLARATGTGMLKYAATKPKRTLYLDCEAGKERLAGHIQRIAHAYQLDNKLIAQNSFWRSMREENHPTTLDLTEKYFQELIQQEIREKAIQFLVIDNLVGFVPGFRQAGGSKWRELFTWLRSLQQSRPLSVLIVHHTNETNDAAGTRDIETQCHNVFHMAGRRSVLNDKNAQPALAPYKDSPGALVRITPTKCKSRPDIEQRPFGAFLSYANATPTVGPKWKYIELGSDKTPNCLNIPVAEETASTGAMPGPWQNRTKEEHQILRTCAAKGEITRSDVEGVLKCSSSKAGELLQKLVADHLLDRVGEGKATRYILRE